MHTKTVRIFSLILSAVMLTGISSCSMTSNPDQGRNDDPESALIETTDSIEETEETETGATRIDVTETETEVTEAETEPSDVPENTDTDAGSTNYRIIYTDSESDQLYTPVNFSIMDPDGLNKEELFKIEVNYDEDINMDLLIYLSPEGSETKAFYQSTDDEGNPCMSSMNASRPNLNQIEMEVEGSLLYDFRFSRDRSKILYDVLYEGDYYTCIMDFDGSNQKRLVNGGYAQFTPDESKIIYYAADENDVLYICIMDIDGTNQKKIAQTVWMRNSPDYSPDGTKIIYNAIGDDQISYIYVMDADGTNQKQLAQGSCGKYSPDGSKIVYGVIDDNQISSLCIMDADGSNQRQLAQETGTQTVCDFSPDGSKIFYKVLERTPEVKVYLYSMDADGSNQKQLAQIDSCWLSSDGSKIFYEIREGDVYDISVYAMNIDGSEKTRLIKDAFVYYYFFEVSPDCSKVLYKNPEDKKIYLMDVNGSNQILIENALHASFSPEGSIYYTTGDSLYVMNPDETNKRLISEIEGAYFCILKFGEDVSLSINPNWE